MGDSSSNEPDSEERVFAAERIEKSRIRKVSCVCPFFLVALTTYKRHQIIMCICEL